MHRVIRRLGDASARRPWVTIGAWAVAAALVIGLAGTAGGAFVDDLVAPGLPPGGGDLHPPGDG